MVLTLDIKITVFVLHRDNTDSWFAFIILSGLYEQVWLSSMFFGAEYLVMASGLLWFNKFLVIYKTQGTESASTSQDYLKITNSFRNRNTPNRT
jgi:hypothetical protein